jgi:hypothetical protein
MSRVLEAVFHCAFFCLFFGLIVYGRELKDIALTGERGVYY